MITKKSSVTHHGVIEKKNALQLHLNHCFNGDLVPRKHMTG